MAKENIHFSRGKIRRLLGDSPALEDAVHNLRSSNRHANQSRESKIDVYRGEQQTRHGRAASESRHLRPVLQIRRKEMDDYVARHGRIPLAVNY